MGGVTEDVHLPMWKEAGRGTWAHTATQSRFQREGHWQAAVDKSFCLIQARLLGVQEKQ